MAAKFRVLIAGRGTSLARDHPGDNAAADPGAQGRAVPSRPRIVLAAGRLFHQSAP
ncbi:MAG: hypothetical protein HYV75_06470 [Opitutae bacterium]|nr:hypothetical protein [Opitutae bacterium]